MVLTYIFILITLLFLGNFKYGRNPMKKATLNRIKYINKNIRDGKERFDF